MNKRTNSHDRSTNDQPSPLEQQLKRMRPRAAHVDLSFLGHPTEQAPQYPTSPDPTSTATQPGFTRVQFATAIAASWLLGAIVGGSCIFFGITRSTDTIAQNEAGQNVETLTQSNITAEPTFTPQPTSTAQAIQLSTPETIEAPLPNAVATDRSVQSSWLLDLDSKRARIESPLTVRGHSQRLGTSINPDRLIATSITRDTSSQSFTPASPTSRSQLMQDLLSDPALPIY